MNPHEILDTLRGLPHETEWVEFKLNNADPEMIGHTFSALANTSALREKEYGYLAWGIEDTTHAVLGTTFNPATHKRGNEPLESWLAHNLSPCPDFRFHDLMIAGKRVVLAVIPAAIYQPIRFKEFAYLRIGSTTKKLYEYPDKERALWQGFERKPFEKRIAKSGLAPNEVTHILNYDAYFRLTNQALPDTKRGILDRLAQDKLIVQQHNVYDITNLGAVLFASKLSAFEAMGRKAIRVIDYEVNDRISGGREYIADSGYAAVFETVISYILSRLPNNEHIGYAYRVQTEMYPAIAIRELVANAMIHQDLNVTGDSPLVEIFGDRIEITNPGKPLIDTQRFIDEPPQSRNEAIASFMRRLNICEERGSGIDKVVSAVEFFQLPPPQFTATERHTRVNLYAHKPFAEMSSKERVQACYQHVCLMSVLNTPATNASLRKRFAFDNEDYKIVTKIIAATVKEKLIKPYDPENRSPRYARYIPFWA